MGNRSIGDGQADVGVREWTGWRWTGRCVVR